MPLTHVAVYATRCCKIGFPTYRIYARAGASGAWTDLATFSKLEHNLHTITFGNPGPWRQVRWEAGTAGVRSLTQTPRTGSIAAAPASPAPTRMTMEYSETSCTPRTPWVSPSLPARRTRLLVVPHLLALFAAGCSSLPQPSDFSPTPGPSIDDTRDIRDVAVEIATGDRRLQSFLRDHPFEVEGIQPRSGNEVDVFVRFNEAVPTSEWPLDVCEFGVANEPMTGIHWRVDLDSERVVTVSPMWGEVSCTAY